MMRQRISADIRRTGRTVMCIGQVLIPDLDGRFPGDPDCKPPFSTYPVLRTM
jgi:hypothetical protein